jgi:anaerobic magnesium-protoporphyrin IX monomethyl ester cyclase
VFNVGDYILLTDSRQSKQTSSRISDKETRRMAEVYKDFSAQEKEDRYIQLLHPCSVTSKSSHSGAIIPPMSLAYLASTLRGAGYPVKIIEAQGDAVFNFRLSECGRYNIQGLTTEEIFERIDPETHVLGISLLFSYEWLVQRELIKAIKVKFPQIIIVAGGEHPTALPEYVLRDCPEIDFVVSGEGEFTFLQLVSSLFYSKEFQSIPGVSFVNEEDQFISNGLSNRIAHVDDIPRPAWDLCKVENYFQPNWSMGISSGRNMPINATRGCPYQCTFCSSPTMWTTRYIMRNPVEVADEFENLVKKYGANNIDFVDLTAIVRKDWTLAFCDELKRRNLKTFWQLPSGTRSEALDEEVLQALYDTGCRLITYAPESASEETLRQIKKKVKIDRLVKSIRTANKIGHTTKVNIVIGFPDDTLTSILKSAWFVFKMAIYGSEDCVITKFSPYPGSELYRRLRNENKIPPPDDNYIHSLAGFMDFTKTESYCTHVGGKTLTFITVTMHAFFYSVAYLTHPKRIIRAIRNLAKKRFEPSNVFEQRLYDVYMRERYFAAKIKLSSKSLSC